MRRIVFSVIAVTLILAAGILSLAWLGQPRTDELKAELDIILEKNSDPLSAMRNSFETHPYLLAVILLNREAEVTGSLYESSRISEPDFALLKSRAARNPAAMAGELPQRGLAALRYSNAGLAGEMILIIQKKLALVDTLKSLRPRSQTMFISFIGFFSLAFLLFTGFLIASFRKDQKDDLKIAHKKEHVKNKTSKLKTGNEPIFEEPEASTPVTVYKPQRSEPVQMLPIENVLSLFLGDLVSHSRIKSATLFKFRAGKPGVAGEWIPRLQRQGAITVTGNSLQEKDLPSEEEISEGLPVLDSKGEKLFVPLLDRGEIWGGILLVSHSNTVIDPSMARDLTEDVKRFSRNLYEHESFTSAVFDADTGFRSSPLFPIFLKEKMLNSAMFHVAIFELPGLQTRSPESLRAWAQSLGSWLNSLSLPTENVFRMSDERFLIFYEKEGLQSELKDALRRLCMTHMGIEPVGAFLPRNTELEGTENFMRRLEKALRIARREGGLRPHENTWHTPVA